MKSLLNDISMKMIISVIGATRTINESIFNDSNTDITTIDNNGSSTSITIINPNIGLEIMILNDYIDYLWFIPLKLSLPKRLKFNYIKPCIRNNLPVKSRKDD